MFVGEDGAKAYREATKHKDHSGAIYLVDKLNEYVKSEAFHNEVFVDVDYICQQLDTLTKEELEYVKVFCDRLIDLK